MVRLELHEIKRLCKDMAELGAASYARRVFPGRDALSQRGAYSSFGESRVKGWVSRGMVSPRRAAGGGKGKVVYSMAELIAAEKSEEINTMINRDKRKENEQ